jgi:glycosyltransferase involved in cell wall biosynthesis
MPDGRTLMNLIRREDDLAIGARKQVYAISQNVADRLKHYNGLDAGVLYPPPHGMENFRTESYGDYFFFPSRITPLKRQELVIEALALVPEPVKVVFAGEADSPAYLESLQRRVGELGVQDKVEWRGRISEEEKQRLYANALMVIFPPVDEDYGYVTPEALLASKAVLTLDDSGGAAEFVQHEQNGLIEQPDPQALAMAISRAWSDRSWTERMGAAGRERIDSIDLSWERIVERLV